MTTAAWYGEVGRQDRAGLGSARANRTRGDAVSGGRGEVWRISDLSAFGRKVVPNDIGRRLRRFAESRSHDTGQGCPSSGDWSDPRPEVTLDRGEWRGQKWHIVTLAATEGLRRPDGRPKAGRW
jgi:hypothetical protein